MCQTAIVSLSKVLTNNVILNSLHSIWHVYQIPSKSILISSVTSFWMPNKLFKVEKKHTSNQVHHLYLQNDSPFSGLLCYHLQTWVEPLFLSSLYYLRSHAKSSILGCHCYLQSPWFLLAFRDHAIHVIHLLRDTKPPFSISVNLILN